MGVTNLDALAIAGVPTMGMSGIPATAGNVFFVNSVSGSNGNQGTAQYPFATIAFAVTQCLAGNGDIIVCTAGHAETITTAGGITINKAGITLWGLGEGADRPKLTFATSTAATFLITSASFLMGGNWVAVCNIASLVTGFSAQAADCTLNIEWHDTSSTIAALRAVTTTAAADRFTLNLVYNGFSATSVNVNAVRLVGGRDAKIAVDYYGRVTTAIVEFVTTAVVNAQISGFFYSSGTTDFSKDVVDTVTGSTWSVSGFDGAAGLSFDGGSGKTVAGNDVTAVTAVQEQVAFKAAQLLVNGNTIFTVAGGPIEVQALIMLCVVGGDSTAATLQFQAAPTTGTATTISGASGSLANAAAGATISLAGTALSTAALYAANGPNLIANPGTVIVPAGTIKMVIGSGPTVTGTWSAYIRFKPLAAGVTVS